MEHEYVVILPAEEEEERVAPEPPEAEALAEEEPEPAVQPRWEAWLVPFYDKTPLTAEERQALVVPPEDEWLNDFAHYWAVEQRVPTGALGSTR